MAYGIFYGWPFRKIIFHTMQPHRIFKRHRLLLLLSFLLCAGFFVTTLGSYFVSKETIREAIISRELPLTSSNIYSEIQKDLVRPVLISSMMAHDTFLRNWVLRGEKDVAEITHYLDEIKVRHGAFSSFFVSERSANYYAWNGILKQVKPQEPRDAWYYRVRDMSQPYEINVDPDLANKDALTIFINYRVQDFEGNYIGATGIGLTVDAVRRLINDYQQRYARTIYFVDPQGKIVLYANESGRSDNDLRAAPGIGPMLDQILASKSGSYQYSANGQDHLLNVSYIPELHWFLFVEKVEDEALAMVRRTLYINLAICVVITLFVLFFANLALNHYQQRIEQMATYDKLTGLLNRQAFAILATKGFAEYIRKPTPISILMVDIDHFKVVNDQHGHLAGDRVLTNVAHLLQESLRKSDIAVRWGGEEFLLMLKDCDLDEAQKIAEKLRLLVASGKIGFDGTAIDVTISIGVAQYDGYESQMQLVSRADNALYSAKINGRNCVCVSETAVTLA